MEYLKQKWTFHFHTLDVNHDGVITRGDVDQTVRDFPKVEGLNEDEGKLAVQKIEKWWSTQILKGREKVALDDFLNDLEKHYTEDKESFLRTIRQSTEEIVGIFDADKTNAISLDNYVKAFQVWGYDNEALLRKAFELYKPDHGIVSIQEFIDDWVTFLTNEDPSIPDVVMDTYKNGLI